jgi:hypothetical protein
MASIRRSKVEASPVTSDAEPFARAAAGVTRRSMMSIEVSMSISTVSRGFSAGAWRSLKRPVADRDRQRFSVDSQLGHDVKVAGTVRVEGGAHARDVGRWGDGHANGVAFPQVRLRASDEGLRVIEGVWTGHHSDEALGHRICVRCRQILGVVRLPWSQPESFLRDRRVRIVKVLRHTSSLILVWSAPVGRLELGREEVTASRH